MIDRVVKKLEGVFAIIASIVSWRYSKSLDKWE